MIEVSFFSRLAMSDVLMTISWAAAFRTVTVSAASSVDHHIVALGPFGILVEVKPRLGAAVVRVNLVHHHVSAGLQSRFQQVFLGLIVVTATAGDQQRAQWFGGRLGGKEGPGNARQGNGHQKQKESEMKAFNHSLMCTRVLSATSPGCFDKDRMEGIQKCPAEKPIFGRDPGPRAISSQRQDFTVECPPIGTKSDLHISLHPLSRRVVIAGKNLTRDEIEPPDAAVTCTK